MKKYYIAVGCGIVILLLARCGSVPQTFYYRVDYELQEPKDGNHTIPLTLGVMQFSTDLLYEGDKIVYRQSPYEVQFYNYRRWIAPPKRIVTERVLRHYQASGVFEKVIRVPSTEKIDYVLSGEIQSFEELDEGSVWYGVVAIEFKLRDNSTQDIIWEKTFSQKTVIEKKQPVEVVRAISRSLEEVVRQSIDEVKSNLK